MKKKPTIKKLQKYQNSGEVENPPLYTNPFSGFMGSYAAVPTGTPNFDLSSIFGGSELYSNVMKVGQDIVGTGITTPKDLSYEDFLKHYGYNNDFISKTKYQAYKMAEGSVNAKNQTALSNNAPLIANMTAIDELNKMTEKSYNQGLKLDAQDLTKGTKGQEFRGFFAKDGMRVGNFQVGGVPSFPYLSGMQDVPRSPIKDRKAQPSKIKGTLDNILEAVGINTGINAVSDLSKVPALDTFYDLYNIADSYRQGDPFKATINEVGALIPGLSGKVIEAATEDFIPKFPEKAKKKMKFILKQSTSENMKLSAKYGQVYWDNPQFQKDYKDEIDNLEQGGAISTLYRSMGADTGLPHAGLGGFLKSVGKGIVNSVHDLGVGIADGFGNSTGLYDINNDKYKTGFGQNVAGFANTMSATTGKIGRAIASAAVPGVGGAAAGALGSIGSAVNPQGVAQTQSQYVPPQSENQQMDWLKMLSANPQIVSQFMGFLQGPQYGKGVGGYESGGQINQLQQILGYKDGSPFVNLPFQTINSNSITMDGVSKNLYLIPDKGRPVLAQGNSGEYYFPNANSVEEIPAMQDGGETSMLADTISNNKRAIGNLNRNTSTLKAHKDINLTPQGVYKRMVEDLLRIEDLKRQEEKGVANEASQLVTKRGLNVDEKELQTKLIDLYNRQNYKEALELAGITEGDVSIYKDNLLAVSDLMNEYGVKELKRPQQNRLRRIIGNNSGFFDPSTDTVYARDLNQIVEEVAHAKQKKDGMNLMSTSINDWLKDPYITGQGHRRQYKTPGTMEHEAHSVIAPKLHEEVTAKRKRFAGIFQQGGYPFLPTSRPKLKSDLNDEEIKAEIKRHEGAVIDKSGRHNIYKDSEGYNTIGYGHLWRPVEPLSLDQEQADAIFDRDYERHKAYASQIPGWDKATPEQKKALINLTFNMGEGWYKKFPKFTEAMKKGDYNSATKELKDSLWYQQVGPRANDVIRSLSNNGAESFRNGGGIIPSFQNSGRLYPNLGDFNKQVSHRDSVANLALNTVLYEKHQGSGAGTGLPNAGIKGHVGPISDEDAVDWAMQNIYPQLEEGYESAMDKGIGLDFYYNAGLDPRIYAYQEYLRKIDPQNKTGWQDKDGNWKDRNKYRQQGMSKFNGATGKWEAQGKWVDPNLKKEFDSLWEKSGIPEMSENDRGIILNNGRDWYYQNTNKGSGEYENTWYGRVNNDKYKKFSPNQPKLKKKEEGGPTNLQNPTEPTYGYLTDNEKLEYVKKLKGYVEKYGFESLAESDPKGAMFLTEQLELLSKGDTEPKDPPVVGGNVAEGEDIVITAKRKREGSNGEIPSLRDDVRERLLNPAQLPNDPLFVELLEGLKEQKSAAQREQEYKKRLQLMFAEQSRQKQQEQEGSNIYAGRGRFQSGGIPILNLSKNINYKRLNPQGMYKFGGLITEGSEYDKREQPTKNPISGASSTGPMGPKATDIPSYNGGVRKLMDMPENEYISTENLIPIQTEKGEMIVMPTGDLVKVMATKRHHQMDEDEVTDVAPEGAYILSSFGKVRINKDEAEQIITETGVKPYRIGTIQDSPTEKNLASMMTKKSMAPADIAKRVDRFFPVNSTSNPFELAANNENKTHRVPYLEGLIQLSELDKLRKGIDSGMESQQQENEDEMTEAFKNGGSTWGGVPMRNMLIPKFQSSGGVPLKDPWSTALEVGTGLFQVGADLWNSYQQRKAQKEFVKKGTLLSDQAYGKARNEMGMGYLAGMLGVMNQDPTVTAKYNDPTYLRQMQTRTPMSTIEAISNRAYANMPNYMQNAPTWQAGLGAQQAAYAAALKGSNDARLTIGEQDRNAQNDWLKLMQTNLELNNNNRVEAVNATRLNRNQQVGAVGNQTQGYMDSLANATLGQLSNQLSLEGVRANANVNFSNNIANSLKGGINTIGTAGLSYLDSRNRTTTNNPNAGYGSGVGPGYGGTGPSTPGYTCVGGSQYAINLDGSLVPTGKGC